MNWKKYILLDPNAGVTAISDGAGAGQGSGAPAGGTQGQQQQAQGTPGAAGGAVSGTAGQPSGGLTKEDIAELVKTVATSVQPAAAPQQQQAPQMSREELDAALKVFRPNAKHVESILAGGEVAVNALQEIVQGVYQQAVTMAAYQLQMQMEPVLGQISPLQQYVQQQQAAALEAEFLTEHKDLADFKPLLYAVRDQLVKEGAKFSTKKAAFDEMAKRTKTILSAMPGVGAGTQGQQQQQPTGNPNGASHQMSTLTGGGQGGAGHGQQQQQKVSAGMAALM